MPSRIFPTRALARAVLLLAFISTRLHQAHAADASGFAITAGSAEKVASDKQLDANQLFAKTWQIKGNAAKNISFVDTIRLNIPGRVFITYAESSASGAIGEIKVSGNSEAVVGVVEVVSNTTAGGPKLVLQTTGAATEGTFLLTEIQLFTKNKLKDVLTKGSADVVVLDNVLYTKGEANAVKSSSSSRRLTDKTGLVVEEKPKTVDATTGRSTKNVFLKPASGSLSDIQNIALSLGVEGAVTLSQLDPDYGDGAYVGYIMISESQPNSNVSTIDQVKLIATHGSDGESLQLQTTATNPKDGGEYYFFIYVVPSAKVKVTNTTSVDMDNYLDIPYNDRLLLTTDGTGDVFVSDKTLAVYADFISLESTGSGNIQVDIGDAAPDNVLYIYSYGSGNVTYLGENLTSLAVAYALGDGRVCLAPKEETFVNIPMRSTTDQVSYTGKKENAFACTTMDLPKRVPGKIGAGEKVTAVAPVSGAAGGDKSGSNSPSSSASGVLQSLVTVSVVTLVSTAVMIFAA
ncbi:hypothetical protein Gpo141_00009967 [Globisporangium polare]